MTLSEEIQAVRARLIEANSRETAIQWAMDADRLLWRAVVALDRAAQEEQRWRNAVSAPFVDARSAAYHDFLKKVD